MRWIVGMAALLGALGSAAAAQAQKPGELIAAQSVTSQVAGSKAWRIRYWTRDESGAARQATGMVIAPDTPPQGPLPVIAWTHGTWGIANDCAPSLSANFWPQTPATQAVARGMTVVAPDYIGLGSGDGMHPFLAGVPTGQAVLDAVRAARSIAGAAAGPRFAVWGESQGGHAALWTARLQPSYAPDLTLVGAAAAAPPTDLKANLRQAPNATVRTFFTAYISASWSQVYGVPLQSFAGPVSRGIIARLSNLCISLGSKPKLGTTVGILTLQNNLRRTDLAAIEPWAGLAARNSTSPARYTVPIMIAQNPKDDLVNPAVTRAYARRLCAAGQGVRWLDVNGSGHATTAIDSAGATLDWIAERFAGKAPSSDCRSI
jgi:pimeloyl-ACP methyl ester carboxylesterase